MKFITQNYKLIINLHNAAIAHKKDCNESCNVSLTQIKMAADILAKDLPTEEKKEYNKLEWPY